MSHRLDTPQISLPFEILPNGRVREVEQDSLDEIAMAVEAILRYPVGYREELPDFGIPDLTFRTDRQEVSNLLLTYVSRWEPRARILVEQRPTQWDEMVQEYVLTVTTTPDV
jgi:phage baseplate assembly protein W